MIDIKNVANTYQGGQGCACGCNGTYATEGRAVTIRVNKINRAMAVGEQVRVEAGLDGETIFEYVAPNEAVTRLYVKEA